MEEVTDSSCAICLNVYKRSDVLVSTTCGHVFHENCLSEWIARSQLCPQCRKKTTDDNVHKIFLNFSSDAHQVRETLKELQIQLTTQGFDLTAYKNKYQQSADEVAILHSTMYDLTLRLSELEADLQKSRKENENLQTKLVETESMVQGLEALVEIRNFLTKRI